MWLSDLFNLIEVFFLTILVAVLVVERSGFKLHDALTVARKNNKSVPPPPDFKFTTAMLECVSFYTPPQKLNLNILNWF